ncbi:MAG: gliding motility-associated C-terminal domain-containing protein [Bacteroidota bacterium]
MKNYTHIILAFSFLFTFSHFLKASHGLPLIGMTYTIGTTGVTVSASSDPATCGSGPFWMQTKVSCTPTAFSNVVPEPCIKTYLQNWTGPGVNYNAFPWYNALLNVVNYTGPAGWPDACALEPYNNNFIPYTDLCPGGVYYFASREIVTGGFGSPGPFGPVISFTVPGTPGPTIPGFVSSNPATSPSNPSCGGGVLLTFTPPQGCGPVKALVPGCASCDSIVWRGPTGVIAVNTLTVLVNPLTTTTYTVKYDTCSGAAKVGCGAPYNPLITVYVANTNAVFAAPPILCAGSTANFAAMFPALNDLWTVSPTTSVTPSSGTGPNFSAVFDDPGIYVVTHQAMNGACTDVQSQTITITPGITSSLSTSGGGCAGPSGSGTATISVSTSTVGLTYLWTPSGGAGNVETNIPFNTTYTVTLSNGGCVVTKTVVISNNPPPSVTSFSVTSPLCNGQSNGVVGVNLTSGNPPFSFTWSPTISQTTQTVTGVGAGTYSVMVMDNNGCTTSSIVTVSEPNVLTVTTSPTVSICSGESTTLTATAAGGTPVYSYTWNPGNINGSSPVVAPLATTQYTCILADANGCTTSQTVNVTVGPALTASANSQSICASGGSVTLTPTITGVGNGGPYTYSWSNSATTSSISVAAGSVPGTTTLTLTISDGCTIPSATAVFTIVTTTAPSVSSFNVIQPFCNGDATGTIAANLSGGSAPFSFIWSPTITQTTQTVTAIAAGTYSVNVTDIAGCTTSSVVNVSQPSAITLTTTANATICAGTSMMLNASPSGGTPGYSYVWNPGNTTTPQALANPTASTVYTCEVMDAHGCIQSQTTAVTVKPVLTATGVASAMCMGDSLLLTPTITSPGNGGPYTYSWSNGATTSATMVYGTLPTSTNYTLTISDGCTVPSATAVFTIATNPPPTANITADSLVGYAPLAVHFTDLGTGGNTFSWNFGNGSTSTSQQPPAQTYQTGGTYQVIYSSTSSSGCVAYDTLSILVIDVIPQIIVPNVFTPNGDKANDFFAVSGINVTSFECSVFNRWGKLVFTSSDIKNAWDGKINGNSADEGTYFFIIKAGGSVGEDIKQQGYVTLFR